MAEIERYRAKAPQRGSLQPSTGGGAAEALATVARVSSGLAEQLGRQAREATDKSAIKDADAAGVDLAMPGVDYAFDASTPATTAPPQYKGGPLASHQKALLDTIAGPESAGRYDVIYGGGRLTSFADHPRKAIPIPVGPNAGKTSSAAGKYQFLEGTWDEYAKKLGLADFSPGSQDQAAWALAADRYRAATGGNLDEVLQSGDKTAIARVGQVLNGTWTSLPGGIEQGTNQNRFVSAYYGSLRGGGGSAAINAAAPTGSAPTSAASPATAPSGQIRVTLTGHASPLQLRPDGSPGADVYNRRITEIYVNRLDTAMRSQMEALALQHEGNPAAMIEALDAARAGLLDGQPPTVRAALQPTFEAVKLGLTRQAVNRHREEIEKQAAATFEENIGARTADVYRLAAGGAADVDAVIENQLGALAAQIDASPLDPVQKQRRKADLTESVLSARVIGGYEAQEDAAARAAYTKNFQDDWQSRTGPVSRLDADAFQRISGELVRRNLADEAAANKRLAAAGKALDGQISVLKKGWPVPPAERQRLRDEVAATGNPVLADNVRFVGQLADWQKAHIAARPEVIERQIAALKIRIQKDGMTEAAATTLDVMEGLHDEMTAGLKNDPLGWAARAGVMEVAALPIAPGAQVDGAALSAALTDRAATAEAIAAHYGVTPRYFTPEEADHLKKRLQTEPLALPSLVSALAAGLGEDTPAALEQLSKDAPLLAHVGGLFNATGDQRPLVEIAEALHARQQPGYKSAMPPDGKMRAAFNEVAAPALAMRDTTGGEMETAAALFEQRARQRGISMEDFDQPNSPARALYQDAVDTVLGATVRDGVKYGGVTSVNGRDTVAPPSLPADAMEDMLDVLSWDDLLFQGAPGSVNGVPIRIDQLRAAQLVMTSPGRYRLALGDIEGGDPRYVPGENGYFELDFTMLARSQRNRGSAASAMERRRQTLRSYGDQFAQ